MGVKNKFSNTETANLWTLLNDCDQFIVPPFQRNYAWTKETAETMWSDLVDGFQAQKNKKEDSQEGDYLLGPIVLVDSGGNKYSIIDGQQRLATITMMFCVARDIMLEYIHLAAGQKPEGYEKIKDMLENTNAMGEHSSWKLTLNDTDRGFFRKIQEQANPDDGQSKIKRVTKSKSGPKSRRLLAENYGLLYDKMMHAVCTNFDDGQDDGDGSIPEGEKGGLVTSNIRSMNHFLTHVSRKNFVVKIVVEDDATAYQIFETLNYRGRQLSKSNLIKNHVLNQIKNKKDQQDLNNKWNEVFDEISNHREADDMFIWESFRSRRYARDHNIKNASRKNLYDIIKRVIKTEKDAEQYVSALEEDADFLKELYDQDGQKDKTTMDDFRAIRTLNAKNVRVPILTAYRKWYDEQNSDYNKLVKFLVKYFFNVKIIQRTHAGKIEKKMSEIVELIENGESLRSIVKSLHENYDHKNFTNGFSKFMTKPSPSVAKYILRQITAHLASNNNDVRPIDSVTVEHILPKNLSKWDQKAFFKGYPKSNAKMVDFVNHLGNLTLLNEIVNKKIQNDQFPSKKGAYRKSNLDINKKTVCNHTEWTARIIERRANQFAKHASKIWNLKGRHHM